MNVSNGEDFDLMRHWSKKVGKGEFAGFNEFAARAGKEINPRWHNLAALHFNKDLLAAIPVRMALKIVNSPQRFGVHNKQFTDDPRNRFGFDHVGNAGDV